MRRAIALLLILSSILVAVHAGDAASDVETAADAAAEAFAAGHEKDLRELARSGDPDPWLVVDELCGRAAFAAAGAFVEPLEGKATARLAEYVDLERTRAGDERWSKGEADVRRRLGLARELLGSDGPEAALALIPRSPDRPYVACVETACLRGELLDRLGKPDEAVRAFEEAAELARSVGWGTRASDALYHAGLVEWRRSGYAKATAEFERHLSAERELDSPMGLGRAHFRVASSLAVLGRTDEARIHREKARVLAKASGDAFYLAKLANDDAMAAARGLDSEGAITAFLEVASILGSMDREALPPRFRPTARALAESRVTALTNAASMAAKLGRTAEARDHARAAVVAARGSPDERVLIQARAYVARLEGVRHQVDGRYFQALASLDRARGLFEQLGMREDMADVLRRTGEVRRALVDLPGALSCHEEAIRILTESGAKRALVDAQLGAAEVSSQLDRAAEARKHYDQALALARELEDPVLEADALTGLGTFHRIRAEYGEALAFLAASMDVHRANPGRTDPTSTQVSLAWLHLALGEFDTALGYAEEVIAVREAGAHLVALATARELRAGILFRLGRYDEAVEAYRKVLEMRRATHGRAGVASALTSVGETLIERNGPGDQERAGALLEEAIGIYVAMGDREKEIVARLLLGLTHTWSDDHEGALEELTYAEELARDAGNPELLASTLAVLAQAHVISGRHDAAIRVALEGSALVGDYALGLSEDARLAARERFATLPQWGLGAALQKGDAHAVYEFLERGKATALVASLGGGAAVRYVEVPAELRQAEAEARAAAGVACGRYAEARRGGSRSEARTRRRELDVARERERVAIGAIQRAARKQMDLAYSRPVALEQVQRRLAPEEALVLFGMSGQVYVAEVLTRDDLRVVALRGLEVDAEIRKLAASPDDDPAARRLTALLIDPLKLDEKVKRLLVSPSGAIERVPFAVLQPRPVALVPSATAYYVLATGERDEGGDVLALGDPKYDEDSVAAIAFPVAAASDASRAGALVPLPETRGEAQAVGDVVLLGEEASESRFRSVVASRPHWRAVHLACHGLLDPVLASRSALALGADKEHDGLLEANELFAQVRVPADLVVLSACETARGRTYGGEGLLGLSRAFMMAGAHRVLASLWRVDDAATRALMVRFYELWNPPEGKGLPPARALREAQDHVRRQKGWEAPRYWAAWVLLGLPD